MKTVIFENGVIRLLDQRLLPTRLKYLECRNWRDVEKAIKGMAIRGAPALGVASSYAMALEAFNAKTKGQLFSRLKKASEIRNARPTARNLSWAIERIERTLEENKYLPLEKLKKIIISEAKHIAEEDIEINKMISKNGARLLEKGSRVLTHCNAGGLACVEIGTALGVLEEAFRQKRIEMIYATETRPLLQGARLTAFELKEKNMPITLIVDSAAAFLIKERMVDCVMVGADRIAGNGDTANKIGTYAIAVLAHHHRLPFYVAAPSSTFDPYLRSGREIVIEKRDCREVLFIAKKRIAPNVPCLNPAFDVTPAKYIDAFITEKGIIKPKEIAKEFKERGPCMTCSRKP